MTGENAVLHAVSSEAASGLVTVLQLERARPAPAPLVGLTPREAEVALLVVDGLADREIAERLHISHHTVSQYVKRIYRKLSVDSRVGLTRLALRAPTIRSATPGMSPGPKPRVTSSWVPRRMYGPLVEA